MIIYHPAQQAVSEHKISSNDKQLITQELHGRSCNFTVKPSVTVLSQTRLQGCGLHPFLDKQGQEYEVSGQAQRSVAIAKPMLIGCSQDCHTHDHQ